MLKSVASDWFFISYWTVTAHFHIFGKVSNCDYVVDFVWGLEDLKSHCLWLTWALVTSSSVMIENLNMLNRVQKNISLRFSLLENLEEMFSDSVVWIMNKWLCGICHQNPPSPKGLTIKNVTDITMSCRGSLFFQIF